MPMSCSHALIKGEQYMKRAVITCTDGTKHILWDSEQEKLIEFTHIVVKNLEEKGLKILSMNIEDI